MKSSKTSKRTKSSKRKSKSSLPGTQPPQSQTQPNYERNVIKGLKTFNVNTYEDTPWAQEEINELELKAVKDLCALSEEENHALTSDYDFQKIWFESTKTLKKDITPVTPVKREVQPVSLRSTVKDAEKFVRRKVIEREPEVVKVESKPEVLKVEPKFEVTKAKQARNFIKENATVKRRISKRQEYMIRGHIERLISSHNTEVCPSLTDSKDESEKKSLNDTNNEKKHNLSIEKFGLKRVSLEETGEGRQNSGIRFFKVFKKNPSESANSKQGSPKKYIQDSMDCKNTNTFLYNRPQSVGKVQEAVRVLPTRIADSEALDLIEKFEQSNQHVIYKISNNLRPKSEAQSRLTRREIIIKGSASPNNHSETSTGRFSYRVKDHEKREFKERFEKERMWNQIPMPRSYNRTRHEDDFEERARIAHTDNMTTEEVEKMSSIRRIKVGLKPGQQLGMLDIHFLINKEPLSFKKGMEEGINLGVRSPSTSRFMHTRGTSQPNTQDHPVMIIDTSNLQGQNILIPPNSNRSLKQHQERRRTEVVENFRNGICYRTSQNSQIPTERVRVGWKPMELVTNRNDLLCQQMKSLERNMNSSQSKLGVRVEIPNLRVITLQDSTERGPKPLTIKTIQRKVK